MRSAAIFVLLFGMISGQNAFGGDLPKDYDPAETRCLAGGDNVINTVLGRIDYVDKELPSVPPEEQRYLDTEFVRALKLVNDELLNNELTQTGKQLLSELSKRPYYDVWYLRRQLTPAKLALQKILGLQPNDLPNFTTYRKNPEAEKLERASQAIYELSQFADELSHYVNKNQSRLTTEENNRFLATTGVPLDLGMFISCKLAKIMGRQSL